MVGHPLHADAIGDITELRGYGQILRDEPYPAVLDFDINSYDDVQTRKGRIAITFLDDSVVRLTENSKLIIDEYIYDPNPDNSSMSLNFTSGTIKFISGNLNKDKYILKTPTADIAVRGTSIAISIEEDTGRSLIILMPDEFGDPSGEVVVSTAMGQVVLNQSYQATTTSVYEAEPSKPVTLDATLGIIIDNMLIVSPPKEEQVVSEDPKQQNDLLDYNDLDIDFLEEDLLAEEDLDFTELDIDYLDVNFLEDLLDVIDALDNQEEADVLANVIDGVDLVGTGFGQDPETQITTILQGTELKLIRTVNQSAQVVLNSDESYTVIFIQDGVSNTVKINNGSSSTITIKQEG